VLQCVAVCFQSIWTRYTASLRDAACCSVLQELSQCVAVCCSVLQELEQCIAVVAVCWRACGPDTRLHCVLQHVAVCCRRHNSVLQCVAVCCSVLQSMWTRYTASLCVAACCSVL